MRDQHDTLNASWRLLSQQWGATGDLWRDEVRTRFEREHVEGLTRTVPHTLNELERLAEVFAQARRQVH